ncbi:MAG: hypothetical protein D3923_08555 [Candidatus Electrothrix sp. AR3]|nr:hypothetical protein [Candidatus Electrothrix sp. AR3]
MLVLSESTLTCSFFALHQWLHNTAMRPLTLLENEQKPSAILDDYYFPSPLTKNILPVIPGAVGAKKPVFALAYRGLPLQNVSKTGNLFFLKSLITF